MFLKTCKHFLLIYFVFGLCPYFTIKPKTGKCEKVLRFVPSCISVGFTMAFIINSFVMNRTIFLFYGKVNDFIAYCYLLVLVVSHLSGNYQCFRYHRVYLDLMSRIHRNEKNFAHLSAYKSNKLRKKILAKSLLFLATYASAIFLLFMNGKGRASIVLKVEIVVLQFASSLNTLHTVMYVEIVRSYLKASGTFILNASLSYDEMCLKKRYLNLKNFKQIHFDCWNIVQKINIYFGWSLLAGLVKCFVEISYTMYFYFLMMQTELDATAILHASTSLLLSMINITILINSCHYCSSEVSHLIENIERYTFWIASSNVYQIKHELLHQIKDFPIKIMVKGFFTMDRRLFTAIVSGCCTYIIIFIQFHLATSPTSPTSTVPP